MMGIQVSGSYMKLHSALLIKFQMWQEKLWLLNIRSKHFIEHTIFWQEG